MPTPMNVSHYHTMERGIRARKHRTRTFCGEPDIYYTLRFRINGKTMERGLGWASAGWSLLKARARLRECLVAAQAGHLPDSRPEKAERPVTLAIIWQDYQKSLTAGMQMVCRSIIRCHLAAMMPMEVQCLRTYHIDTLRAELEQKQLRPQTVKHVLAFIRQLVRWGAKRGYCAMPGLDRLFFDMPQFDNTTTEYLAPQDIRRLLAGLDACNNQILACSMRLALCTGMRRGAIFALRWDDLDFTRKTIRLRGEVAKSGKTAYIAMNDDAIRVLQQLARLTGTRNGLLFAHKDASQSRIRSFIKYIKAFLPKGYRPYYCLRHTFASILANAGVNQITLQRAMTHSSVTMVQRYAHLQPETLAQASAAVTKHLAAICA